MQQHALCQAAYRSTYSGMVKCSLSLCLLLCQCPELTNCRVLVALKAVPASICSMLGAQHGLPAFSHHEVHVGCPHQGAHNADRCTLKAACSMRAHD